MFEESFGYSGRYYTRSRARDNDAASISRQDDDTNDDQDQVHGTFSPLGNCLETIYEQEGDKEAIESKPKDIEEEEELHEHFEDANSRDFNSSTQGSMQNDGYFENPPPISAPLHALLGGAFINRVVVQGTSRRLKF